MKLIREKESEFLRATHPQSTPHSWDHYRHRIEVLGVSIGGEGGIVLTLANHIVLFAEAEA